jgi:hypothetical protein
MKYEDVLKELRESGLYLEFPWVIPKFPYIHGGENIVFVLENPKDATDFFTEALLTEAGDGFWAMNKSKEFDRVFVYHYPEITFNSAKATFQKMLDYGDADAGTIIFRDWIATIESEQGSDPVSARVWDRSSPATWQSAHHDFTDQSGTSGV